MFQCHNQFTTLSLNIDNLYQIDTRCRRRREQTKWNARLMLRLTKYKKKKFILDSGKWSELIRYNISTFCLIKQSERSDSWQRRLVGSVRLTKWWRRSSRWFLVKYETNVHNLFLIINSRMSRRIQKRFSLVALH